MRVEGGVYHVYNRLGLGERVFELNEIAGEFIRLLSDVVSRNRVRDGGGNRVRRGCCTCCTCS